MKKTNKQTTNDGKSFSLIFQVCSVMVPSSGIFNTLPVQIKPLMQFSVVVFILIDKIDILGKSKSNEHLDIVFILS